VPDEVHMLLIMPNTSTSPIPSFTPRQSSRPKPISLFSIPYHHYNIVDHFCFHMYLLGLPILFNFAFFLKFKFKYYMSIKLYMRLLCYVCKKCRERARNVYGNLPATTNV
jgi:hypothetical protein